MLTAFFIYNRKGNIAGSCARPLLFENAIPSSIMVSLMRIPTSDVYRFLFSPYPCQHLFLMTAILVRRGGESLVDEDCPSWLSVAVRRHWSKLRGGKGLFGSLVPVYHRRKPRQALKARNRRQELKQRPQRKAASWLTPLACSGSCIWLRMVPLYQAGHASRTCPQICLMEPVFQLRVCLHRCPWLS